MNKFLLALAVLLVVGGTAVAQVYVPQVVTSYYPPVYAAPAAYAVPAPVVYSAYYAPPVYAQSVVVARPRVAYMPVAPTVVAAPVVVGPTAVVRSKVYYRGHPVRNTVRYVLP